MLACIHKARRYFVGRLPNSCDMMMTLMFAANMTTTDSTSTSTSLQITTMEFYKLSCVFVCGYRYKNVNIDSMFVVIDRSKCPTRQELCPWPMHLAATLLLLSKHTNGNIVQTA